MKHSITWGRLLTLVEDRNILVKIDGYYAEICVGEVEENVIYAKWGYGETTYFGEFSEECNRRVVVTSGVLETDFILLKQYDEKYKNRFEFYSVNPMVITPNKE
jgi:hypothetical protein